MKLLITSSLDIGVNKQPGSNLLEAGSPEVTAGHPEEDGKPPAVELSKVQSGGAGVGGGVALVLPVSV